MPNRPQPLILLHGWGMHASVWNPLLERLPPEIAARPLDLPGHGTAPYNPARPTLDDWADACLEAAGAALDTGPDTGLDAVPGPAVWVGWSLGGLVALAAALRAPERVSGLVLIGATPRFAQSADWPDAMPLDRLDRFHADLDADPAATLSRFLALQVRGGAEARDTLRRLKRDLASRPAPDPAALAQGLALLRGEDLRGRLASLACPTLWILGRHDTLVPAAAAPAIARRLPEARIRIIEGAAHAPQLSHPGETLAAIMEWPGRDSPA